MKRSTAIGPAALVAAVVLVLSGCSVTQTQGPLSAGDKNTLCLPSQESDVVTARAAVWDYPQGPDLTIDTVTLKDADAVELVDTVFVPSPAREDGSGAIVGIGLGLPPDGAAGTTQLWDQRFSARGAVLAPQQDPRVLYVVMRRTGDEGTVSGVIVDYHDASGTDHQVTVDTGYRLPADEFACGL